MDLEAFSSSESLWARVFNGSNRYGSTTLSNIVSVLPSSEDELYRAAMFYIGCVALDTIQSNDVNAALVAEY